MSSDHQEQHEQPGEQEGKGEIRPEKGRITGDDLTPEQRRLRAIFSQKDRPKPKPRLTVVEQITHQIPDGDAFQIPGTAWTSELESDEQPFGPRRIEISDRWGILDFFWLNGNVGMLWLRNDSADTDIEIGVEQGTVTEVIQIIRPRRTQFCQYLTANKLRVRAVSGTVRATMVAFPK